MNKLYFIIAYTPDAESHYLLVIADTPANAFAQWELYYYDDAKELRENGYEPHNYSGELILESFPQYGDMDMRVYEVDTDLSRTRPLAWHSPDVKLVAYVKEDGE